MTALHDGHEKHWWWDNVNHFVGGFALGLILPHGKEERLFFPLAIVWEGFEWWLARQKLYERYDWYPEGPRSMGYKGWSLDHQVEDTILDTVVGYYGVKLAMKLKGA